MAQIGLCERVKNTPSPDQSSHHGHNKQRHNLTSDVNVTDADEGEERGFCKPGPRGHARRGLEQVQRSEKKPIFYEIALTIQVRTIKAHLIEVSPVKQRKKLLQDVQRTRYLTKSSFSARNFYSFSTFFFLVVKFGCPWSS